jgi:hypothetical protein
LLRCIKQEAKKRRLAAAWRLRFMTHKPDGAVRIRFSRRPHSFGYEAWVKCAAFLPRY